MSTIYVIENTVNSKKYVGQTRDLNSRRNNHFSKLRTNKHPNKHLQSSWNKHGESAFIFKVLIDDLPEKYVDDMERGLIATLRTMIPKYGYNSESGGNANKRASDQTRKRIGDASRGRKASEETRQKMRAKVVSEETRQKMSKAHKGRVFTEEWKQKISRAKTGKKRKT